MQCESMEAKGSGRANRPRQAVTVEQSFIPIGGASALAQSSNRARNAWRGRRDHGSKQRGPRWRVGIIKARAEEAPAVFDARTSCAHARSELVAVVRGEGDLIRHRLRLV